MKKRIESDEIDLIEIFINIWANKLKIAAITFVFIASSVLLSLIFKPLLSSKTEILPITIFEDSLYSSYNSIVNSFNATLNYQNTTTNNKKIKTIDDIIDDYDASPYKKYKDVVDASRDTLTNIDRDYLLNLFIAKLQTKETIQKAIIKYQLLDRKKYFSEDEYLEAVEKKALNLNLLAPVNVDGSKKGPVRANWTIEFKINDKKKWQNALNFIETDLNKKIRNYMILDVSLALDNLRLLKRFKLEDLNDRIQDERINHKYQIINRLAFLREQAQIARRLNIEYSDLFINNINIETPYYLRGFLMIEKKIELIETRKNKDAFIPTVYELNKEKREFLNKLSLDRLEALFDKTPILSDTSDFKAATIVYKNIKYDNSFKIIKIILAAGITGIIFGMCYVLVSSAIRQRK